MRNHIGDDYECESWIVVQVCLYWALNCELLVSVCFWFHGCMKCSQIWVGVSEMWGKNLKHGIAVE